MFEHENGKEADLEHHQTADITIQHGDKGPTPSSTNDDHVSAAPPPQKERQPPSDMDMMKERFSKLLLGEDMSGGGKGVSSALALSNAITNLAASVFGEQSKLQPMAPDRKARWKKEVEWLLSVTDYIVELVPSEQTGKDGKIMEIMVTQKRRDLLMNIPALKKLDNMLLDCLDNCKDQNEFWYVSKDADESEKGVQKNAKWWLPTVKVPPNGLSEASRKWLQYQKDCVNQVLKASMAINAQILLEMEIPESYIESLPKNGRSSLGDYTYKSITVEFFDPEQFLSTMDLSSEHKILDLKNKIEASIVIWKRKMNQKEVKSAWSSGVSLEKREQFEERAETILLLLKHRFPGLPQSSLDISKIQFNKDVGHSVLESYSRVLESLANTVMSRIEDVLYADSLTQEPPSPECSASDSSTPGAPPSDLANASAEDAESGMTLLDFMGWNLDSGGGGEAETKNNNNSNEETDEKSPMATKPLNANSKKISYVEKIESRAVISPTARH
ncbi:PREDICTED: rho guanine nucleotide exchange factor 8 [Ipomoea nil]|uniref:rho guanine nucleotide exchange factor 8 n=1 Tax=Ipomoea nil TaxID=35883 RepID=UPI000901A356|nr:PREDICTED: rho guanine nucleotide exchange factor 8 [Ipomoea nil]